MKPLNGKTYKSSPKQLSNLRTDAAVKEHSRSEMKSFRMTSQTKDALLKKLSELKMSLGDFIEVVADGEVVVIEDERKIVARIK